MCNNIILLLSMIFMIIESYFAIPNQPLNKTERLIKQVALNNCKIEEDDQFIQDAHLFDNCHDKSLPVLDKKDILSFFKEREYFVCVGYYQVLSGLCTFYDVKKPFHITYMEDSKNASKICNISRDLYTKLNLDFKNDQIMQDWFQFIKETMSNQTFCQNLCVFLGQVDPKCTVLLQRVNLYNELNSAAATGKTSASNAPNPSNQNLDNVDSVQNKEKISLDTVKPKEVQSQGKQPVTLLDQSSIPSGDVKTENSGKQTVNTVELNISGTQLEKEINPAQNAQEKAPVLPIPAENINKVIPVSSTSNSLQPEQEQPKESVIQSIPNDMDRQDVDAGGFDINSESLPPSSEKEVPLDEENKQLLGDRFSDGVSEGTKPGSQLNTNDQDVDELPREYIRDNFKEAEDSNFFAYFLVMTGGCIVAYVLFHNRNKLVALALEGRKGRSARARGGGRHSSASYSKLHSNLEEAIASSTTAPSAANVLY